MPNILIRDIEPELLENLKLRAQYNGRSLQAEVKRILEQSASAPPVRPLSVEDRVKLIKRLQEQTKGRQFSDSADLIREDRDR
jgi:plasmid stability protein